MIVFKAPLSAGCLRVLLSTKQFFAEPTKEEAVELSKGALHCIEGNSQKQCLRKSRGTVYNALKVTPKYCAVLICIPAYVKMIVQKDFLAAALVTDVCDA